MTTIETNRTRQRRPERSGLLESWFRPKPFETERRYDRLGARLIKLVAPTGGDLVMHWCAADGGRALGHLA